ncbi:MAG: hypothetical protein LBL01_05160, partial [Bifidobacteriaceae bacterium]|nr:hypothetical protein [Bifidobacteriaceae bacterium]
MPQSKDSRPPFVGVLTQAFLKSDGRPLAGWLRFPPVGRLAGLKVAAWLVAVGGLMVAVAAEAA